MDFLPAVSAVCCQVEVPAADWPLVQRTATESGVIVKPRESEDPGPLGAFAEWKKKFNVITEYTWLVLWNIGQLRVVS